LNENTFKKLITSLSSEFNQYWKKAYGDVIAGSSHTLPPAVLPNYVPSAFVNNGTVNAYALPLSTRRMRSNPAVIFPH